MRTLIILILFTANCFAQSLWFQVNTGTTQDLTRIKSGGGKYWITGKNGTLLLSTTQGTTWSQVQTNFNYNFNDIHFVNGLTGYIAASGGNILKTTDAGSSWTALNTGTTQNVNSISASSARIIAICNGGVILRSTNSGVNWSQANVNNFDLKSLTYTYPDYLACGNNGTIIRSSDLGSTWNAVPIATTNNLNFIIHKTADTIFACGLNVLMRSVNGGANWTFLNAGFLDNFTSFAFHSWGWYYLTASSGKVYRSLMSGNWQIDHTVTVPVNYMNSQLPAYGWAVGNGGLLIWPYLNTYWDSYNIIDANSISTPYRTNGSFNRNVTTGNSGFEWPKGENKHARYASGLWLGAIVDDDTLVAIAEYDYEFFPGYTDNNGNPQAKLDSLYRVYKMDANINNNDRTKWPNALLGNSNQGAPVYYDQTANSWKPLDFGAQTLYHSMTDSYPESHHTSFGNTAPLKADIKVLSYSFVYPGVLNNTVITRYTIINRSNKVWNNFYAALWTDDDVGDATDDMVACDTNLNLAYTYNGDNNDGVYGAAPPAVGFVMLKGPAYYTGNNNDTSWICNANSRINKVGYKDKGMNVFNWYDGGPIYGDPRRYYDTYRILKGLTRDAFTIINPVTNQPTTYMYSGDPVTGTGWFSGPIVPSDQRFLMTTGPVNLNPGDTQYIVFAQVIARGTSNLNSITVLRQYAQEVINFYNSCFAGVPIGVQLVSHQVPESFELYQNYPNPFNPTTKIKFNIPYTPLPFGKGTGVRLCIYNTLGQMVKTLVNEHLQPGKYEAEFDGTNYASGLYFYSLIVDNNVLATRKLILLK